MAIAATARDIEIMRGVWQKLDSLPLSFGARAYDDSIEDAAVVKFLYGDLKDTLRELRLLNTDTVPEMSTAEMRIENRTVYYVLKRNRLSSSVFFRYSTATDGKAVDKSMIPKMLTQILWEYDAEFKAWRGSSIGSFWTIASTVETSGEVPTI